MTSVHAYTQPQANPNNPSLNQTIQSPNNFNEAERVHRRMDELRKHHNESEEIYNRTQPIINEQIHVETVKYLKSNQVNGITKPKSQKPRAQRKRKNSSSNINTGGVDNSTNLAQPINTTSSVVTNGLPLHQSQMQPKSSQLQPNHLQQTTTCTPNVQQQQQQSMCIQPKQPSQSQQQQLFKYQSSANVYQQLPQQTTLQVREHYQTPQQQQIYSQQPQQLQQPMHLQNPSHVQNQPNEQNQYVVQQPMQNHHQLNGTHLASNNHGNQPQHYGYTTSYAPATSSHNDLDLTLQAGLECDVDSLIRHEMSVEGRLEFNHDLLLKLDNHYHPYHQ